MTIFLRKVEISLLAMDMLAELELLIGEPSTASVLLDASQSVNWRIGFQSEQVGFRKPSCSDHPNGRQPPLVLFHGDYVWGGGHLVGGADKAARSRPAAFCCQPLMAVATSPFRFRSKPWPPSVCP